MVSNRKITGRASSIPAGVAYGAIISMSITIIIAAVVAHLISSEMLSHRNIGYSSMIILFISSLTGSWCGAKRIKRLHIQTAAMCGCVYFLTLLAITAVFFGGQYEGIGITLTLIVLGSTAGGFIAARKPKKANSFRHRNKYR